MSSKKWSLKMGQMGGWGRQGVECVLVETGVKKGTEIDPIPSPCPPNPTPLCGSPFYPAVGSEALASFQLTQLNGLRGARFDRFGAGGKVDLFEAGLMEGANYEPEVVEKEENDGMDDEFWG